MSCHVLRHRCSRMRCLLGGYGGLLNFWLGQRGRRAFGSRVQRRVTGRRRRRRAREAQQAHADEEDDEADAEGVTDDEA